MMGQKFLIDWEYEGQTGKACIDFNDDNAQDEDPLDEFIAGNMYWIFEGNFGCDCNRCDVIGLPTELPCGDTIKFTQVELYRNGEIVATGSDNHGFIICPRHNGGDATPQ